MGSAIKGSGNVAEQISQDCAGQTVDWTDDVIQKIDGDTTDTTKGFFLTSEDGSVWKVAITDAGVVTPVEIS